MGVVRESSSTIAHTDTETHTHTHTQGERENQSESQLVQARCLSLSLSHHERRFSGGSAGYRRGAHPCTETQAPAKAECAWCRATHWKMLDEARFSFCTPAMHRCVCAASSARQSRFDSTTLRNWFHLRIFSCVLTHARMRNDALALFYRCLLQHSRPARLCSSPVPSPLLPPAHARTHRASA